MKTALLFSLRMGRCIGMNKYLLLIILAIMTLGGIFLWQRPLIAPQTVRTDEPNNQLNDGSIVGSAHELQISTLRNGTYPGSELTVEQALPKASNYSRTIVSYRSEGNKIYALLTVPDGEKPITGWPVIVFNHGYIPPAQYRTTERYVAYTDAFSRNGYIVLKPDYRGHGDSEGTPSGAYGSNGYTVDVLNAVSSIKKYKEADPNRIGMWGHSMGGFITLRSMVVSKDIKAGVIWGGVVGSYEDMMNRWRRATGTPNPTIPLPSGARRWRQELVARFGDPAENPEFWKSISATSYLMDISGPLQIHHGQSDTSVPVEFSETLHALMQSAGKSSELFVYPGDDHNISHNLSTALNRSVTFFDTNVKGGDQ